MIAACATRSGPRNMVIRDLEGILNRLADLRHFLTLVDFFQKIAFFAIFLLKTPFMNERNKKINSKWNIVDNKSVVYNKPQNPKTPNVSRERVI